ncbi:hypothetical protein BH23ACT4_BH23ACT4_12250 [soil metagenome]
MSVGPTKTFPDPGLRCLDPRMDEEWYYCIEHKTVEPKLGCRITTRIGPFPTREEAAKALDRVAERNDEWESDPDWNDGGDEL